MRGRGLEKFLRQVARHPVLGCTRFLKVFLTDKDAKPDKVSSYNVHLHIFPEGLLFSGMEDWQALESPQS